ncbi:MAG: hypothetical protein ABSH19_00340 [Opitutales bacterium]
MKPSRLHLLLWATGLACPAMGLRADTPPPAPTAPPTGIVTLTAPKSDEVVNPLDRERLLTVANHDLDRTDPEIEQKLQSYDNPFFLKLPPPPPEIQPTTAGPAPPPPPPKLSDTEKLAQVAGALKPSGTLGMGGVQVLIFEDRPPLRAGQLMEVTFPGDDRPTEIVLLSVSEKSYTLKLNGTVLPVSLNRPSTEEKSTNPPDTTP